MNDLTQKIISEATEQFGTPIFLYHSHIISEQYKRIRHHLPDCCDIYYSMKANPLLGICQYFSALGCHCEVSSSNELLTALKAGFPPEKIIFVGPAKKYKDIELCINKKIRLIVCESINEMKLINELAIRQNIAVPVLIRINPDFYIAKSPIKMSGVASQFGVSVDEIINNKKDILSFSNLSIDGIHVYNASRVLDIESILDNIQKIFLLAEYLSDQLCIQWKVMDLGGGLGVPYFSGEKKLDIDVLASKINLFMLSFQKKHPEIKFILELGRFLIAESGFLITAVQSVKKNHDKCYAIVDAGMHCYLATTGLGSFIHRNFQAILFSKNTNCDADEKKTYQIAGPLCTPGDILLRDFECDSIYPGDWIVICNAGAYGISASPGKFLSHGSPAEVVLHNKTMLLARRAETFEDLLSCQIELNWTKEKINEKN